METNNLHSSNVFLTADSSIRINLLFCSVETELYLFSAL